MTGNELTPHLGADEVSTWESFVAARTELARQRATWGPQQQRQRTDPEWQLKELTYPLTVTKQIPDAQLVDLCDLLDGHVSPWLLATETDLEKERVTVTHNPRPANGTEDTVTTVITFSKILVALAALRDEGELCCAAAMVGDELGAGCAVDADLVFRRALLGASVYR
ncbi:hypothetical protein [Microbacterium sp. NFH-22A-Y]|uniref:hypothetical protein n=1 Tax=Microbacterium sp. NFH-22A-Y TaxID=2744448 RepID=UPI001F3EFEB5|nr:hypothetical protein [Microbacterium sp. NFH-22A-Y]